MLKYTIPLAPVSKKNSQRILVNQKTGKPFVAPSQAYKNFETSAGYFLRPKPKKPIQRPVTVKVVFYMATRRRVDLTNLLEAIDDTLVHWGILEDDHSGIVVSHDGSRVLYDKDRPRVEVEIEEDGYECKKSEGDLGKAQKMDEYGARR